MMLHGIKKVAVITNNHYGVRVYALNKASDLSPWTSTFKIKTSLRKKNGKDLTRANYFGFTAVFSLL